MKVAIKLPQKLKDVILAFPFLHSVVEELKPEYLHLVAPPESFDILRLLPFSAYFHDYNDKDYENFFDVHRFCVNKKDLSHADVFFALAPEPKDQFMSLCFRGQKRVGFEHTWGKYFLNVKETLGEGLHQSERYFKLLNAFLDNDFTHIKKVEGKKLKPAISDYQEMPYLIVDLPYDPIDNEVPSDWIEFVDLFEKKRIFLTCHDADAEKRQDVLERFINKLKMPVDIHSFLFNNYVEFAQIAAYSKGVVTYNNILSQIAAYMNCPTIILYDKGEPKIDAPLYFNGQCNIHSSQDVTLLKKEPTQDVVTKLDLGKVFDKAIKLLPND